MPRDMAEIAVACVNEQRSADFSLFDDLFHCAVAGIIAAHKANLYQTAAACHFCLDDLHAVLGGRRKGLFTEYILGPP